MVATGIDAPSGPDTVGPLNALEADRHVEDLRTFPFVDIGSSRWLAQHEFLTKLNLQAHVNAASMRDEFVLEAFVLHEKLPLIIRELVACERWKQNAYPLMKTWLDENNSIKGYLLLYQEGVLINLLEALLYHKQGCEAAGDLIVELVDYCHRKLVFLLNAPPPNRPANKDDLKKQLLKEAEPEHHSAEQEYSINMSCAMCCLSMVRFMTDHIDALPLAVTARILDTYDLLMVLCPLLEVKPWLHEAADGEQRRFLQGHWARVPEAEARQMAKAEAQCWLAVYNLVLTPSVRRRYQFNSYRKNVLLRVRKFLHETTVDQIPILVELMARSTRCSCRSRRARRRRGPRTCSSSCPSSASSSPRASTGAPSSTPRRAARSTTPRRRSGWWRCSCRASSTWRGWRRWRSSARAAAAASTTRRPR